MVKVTHLEKLEIVRLFESGFTSSQISRAFKEKGLTLSRQLVEYWWKQHITVGLNDDNKSVKVYK